MTGFLLLSSIVLLPGTAIVILTLEGWSPRLRVPWAALRAFFDFVDELGGDVD